MATSDTGGATDTTGVGPCAVTATSATGGATDIPGVGKSLGNVHVDDWKSISTSDRFKYLDREIQAGNEKCRLSCEHFLSCGGGAPSNKWFEHHSFSVAETMYCRLAIQAVNDEYSAAIRDMSFNEERDHGAA